MWTITQLKENAKSTLKNSYWIAFAVCFVAGILGGSSSGWSLNIAFPAAPPPDSGVEAFFWAGFAVFMIIVSIFVGLFSLALLAFVTNPVLVGKSRYFVQGELSSEWSFLHLFSVFKKGQYLSVVKTMILRDLFVGLWSLVFIIPGIIKGYSWRMVPYILAENPEMPYKEALELSARMTDGEKFDMFVLDLSFIGWYLLGVLACGIGVLFVNPYFEATWAQLYFVLRQKVGFGAAYV
jgi:uncharacterized membrane protein